MTNLKLNLKKITKLNGKIVKNYRDRINKIINIYSNKTTSEYR